jgi:hypothetical protein
MSMPHIASSARVLALVLAIVTVAGSLLVAVPTAKAPLTGFGVTPGLYSHPGLIRHPYVYVPGETVTFTVTGDTVGELFDAIVLIRSTATILSVSPGSDNVPMPASLSITFTYTIPSSPASLPDGDDYQVEVGNANYLESGRNLLNRLRVQRFAIQAYELRVEVDRPAYLGGDDVIVTWYANNLRDGSLAPDGFGQLWVYDALGASLITPGVQTYAAASGSYQFTLPNLANPQWDGIVDTWFNDTPSNPARHQQAFWFFDIDSLGVIADVTPNQYAPGGIVTVDVSTLVSFDQTNPSPFDPPEPNINVDITVWELPPVGTPVEHQQYRSSSLVSDTHGQLTYVFKLDDNVLGTDTSKNFEVRANARHNNGIWQWEDRDTFTVSEAAGFTIVLQFNQDEYQADDTATVLAVVNPTTAGLTYIFEVRDTTNDFCTAAFPDGGLLANDVRTTNSYSYQIPQNFDGQICFRVTADDGQGNRVTSARAFDVVFGWLLVNSDRREYRAGETVTFSWTLASNRITTPTYFWEVRDADGNLVRSGAPGSARSYGFSVPSPASRFYTFTVTATQGGRAITGAITVSEVTGFFLTITFDRSLYGPGDTMTIHYTIARRGSQALPSTFVFSYGLINGPSRVVSTASATGDLSYAVPTGIDEGDQLFSIFEANTGTGAAEVVGIQGGFGAFVAGISVFDLFLLFLTVVLFLMLWRRGVLGGMGMGPRAPSEPAPPSRMEPVHASPGTPMTVTCRSCGSPIEITTSKRPIEVMCPKCGNTEMVS